MYTDADIRNARAELINRRTMIVVSMAQSRACCARPSFSSRERLLGLEDVFGLSNFRIAMMNEVVERQVAHG